MYIINTSTGIVTRISDNKQVAPAQSTDDPDYVEYVAWVAQGNTPTEVTIPIVETRRITKLAFRNRFTTTEKVTLEMASIDNPATTQTRQMAATLRVYMKDLETATFIDLERPDTQAAVMLLASAGLITTDRANAILHDPVQPHEIVGG